MQIEAITVEHNHRLRAVLPQSGGGSCRTLFTARSTAFDFSNPNRIPLRPQQVIELSTDPKQTVLTAFVLFLFPLLLAMAAFAGAKHLSPLSWIPPLAALFSFPVSLGAAFLFTRLTRHSFRPVVVRVLDKPVEACSPCESCKSCAACSSAPHFPPSDPSSS